MIAGISIAGACVAGAGCCGAFFWCSQDKKKASPGGNNTGDSSAGVFGTSAPKISKRPRRAISLESNDSTVVLDNPDESQKADFDNGHVEDEEFFFNEAADFEDVCIDHVIPIGVDFARKRGVVVVTRSPPGWFFEKILRHMFGKKEPVVPESSLTNKSTVVRGYLPELV
jgi:hypothetical protein